MADLETILSLRDQVALITGASRGIGRAMAEVFGTAGARLALVALDPARLATAAEVLRRQGFEVQAFACDVADAVQVQRVVEQVIAEFGRVDILVNNAGVLQAGPITDFTPADWERTLAVNLNSAF